MILLFNITLKKTIAINNKNKSLLIPFTKVGKSSFKIITIIMLNINLINILFSYFLSNSSKASLSLTFKLFFFTPYLIGVSVFIKMFFLNFIKRFLGHAPPESI